MKRNILHKFQGINFPIFVLSKKPAEVKFTLDKIYCRTVYGGHLQTVDDKNITGDYFNRLLTMPNRIHFERTCKNVRELVQCKAQWGIDSLAIPHDFSKKIRVPAEIRRVTKVRGNLIWCRGISYPFEMATSENIRLDNDVNAILIKINEEWFIKELTYETKLGKPYVSI